MHAQFAHIEAFSVSHYPRLVGELTRQPQYSQHVESPQSPTWCHGSESTLNQAVRAFLDTPAPVRGKDGKLRFRKRRKDCRGLVAGVLSWPISIVELREAADSRERLEDLTRWVGACRKWLIAQFGDHLQAVAVHCDESHPHIHFMVVGEAHHWHPGLKAEYRDGGRIESQREKRILHARALSAWQDDYHAQVASHFGMVRKLRSTSLPRIRDRATALHVRALEKAGIEREALREIAELSATAVGQRQQLSQRAGDRI